VVVLALRGRNAVAVVRKMMGATFGSKAEPGTIRGDFAISDGFNLVHGSDSPEAAAKEIGLFFGGALVDWKAGDLEWVYDVSDGAR
jgi:nucleoside-diphosphate kinase